MPLYSIAAQNKALDGSFANFPTPLQLVLLTGPLTADASNLATVELPATSDVDDGAGGITTVANGYARVNVALSSWAAAADGMKSTTSPVSFGVPDAEWEEVTHFALVSGADVYDSDRLSEPLDVTSGGGSDVLVTPVVRYDNRSDLI